MIGRQALPLLESTFDETWTTDLLPVAGARHVVTDLVDPTDVAALGKIAPDVTIHLSGLVSGTYEQMFTANVVGTMRLLAQLPRGSRVVMAGSAAEYAPGDGRRLTEDHPLQPSNRYGWAKLSQTVAARQIAAERDLRLTVARPFNVVGPALPPTTALGNMAAQLRGASGPVEVEVGRLDVVRDYVFLELVAQALVAIAADRDPPEAVNVCSGVGLELGEVFAAMIDLLGVDAELVPDPRLVSLPASPAVVGDPTLLITRYGIASQPNAHEVARRVLGLGNN